jgi:C-terminal processing protease CtpA/Prc
LPGKNTDRGVLPDIEVEYTFEDYISNRDLDLEKVKTLIHKDISEDSN